MILTNNIKKNIFLLTIVSMFLFIPFIQVQAKITPDCGTLTPKAGSTTGQQEIANPCDFDDALKLINKLIEWLLIYFATPLAAIALCYAGFLMITSGGNSGKVTTAKTIIKNIVFGYIIALAAYLIIKTIFSVLGFKGETFLSSIINIINII